MQIGIYSHTLVILSFAEQDLPLPVTGQLYDYLVHGKKPNDMLSHIIALAGSNQVVEDCEAAKMFNKISKWMEKYLPQEAKGSQRAIEHWTGMSDSIRRGILEYYRIIFTKSVEQALTFEKVSPSIIIQGHMRNMYKPLTMRSWVPTEDELYKNAKR